MAVSKDDIVAEIQRLAADNGGKPLGRLAFVRKSGIRESDWLGRYWLRWSDAVIEAGFAPNAFQSRIDDDELLDALLGEVRRLGHFPTQAEMRMRRRNEPSFPARSRSGYAAASPSWRRN